jgi:pimeloyl-[acyl-carrier protein] methyl ester esterase
VKALYRERSGTGPPLALLHGWGMNLRLFDPLRAQLAPHYTVTAWDLPGHGRSPWVAGIRAAEQVEWLASQLPHDALLVGWSLGGQLALQLACHDELRIRGLVLISTTPRFVRSADWPYGLAATVLAGFAAALERDQQRTLEDFLALQVRGSAEADAVMTTLRQALREPAEPAALAAGLEMLRDNDLRALARTLELPTLVIAGQYDRVAPPAAAQALVQMMPDARLLTVARAGHAPFLSHPQVVLEALLAAPRRAHANVGPDALDPVPAANA